MLFDKRTLPTSRRTLSVLLVISLLSLGLLGILSVHATPNNPRTITGNSTLPKGVIKNRTGEQVFQQLCAGCHGLHGEGGKGYKRPLTGDQSVGELARFIHQEMPPDAPRKLPVEDARQVAAYIHDAFYSPVAQARNKPARIELSRLTVRQYRNAISDLVGSFRPENRLDSRRGLAAQYFKTRQNGPPILERVDPEVHFDFGTKGALPEQDDPYQFVMHWQGSVLAPDTGEYEFIVRTEQAAVLWVNDLQQPLIDVRVKSGNDNEYRASLFLLGGRCYPLRLEFYKGVRGVDDLKKLKEKPPQKASITLAWKQPKRADEVIPHRYLFPMMAAPNFVLTTPFPPDDRSLGYERGASVSKEWDEATAEAAMEVADYIATHLREIAGVADDAADRDAKLREFCRKFTARAFRRPLTEEVSRFFVARQFQNAPNLETAVKRVVLLTLNSPRFLYREIAAPEARPWTVHPLSTNNVVVPAVASAELAASSSLLSADPYDVASRLSFVMWDSLPDEELLKAAGSGQLATQEQVLKQAERMAEDPRAWFKMRDFLLQWFKVDSYPDLAKDEKQYPHFDAMVASDLRTSFELTLEHIVWSEKSDFRELMLTDTFFLNGRLAQVYGELLPVNAPFQMVSMDFGRRCGILTHPYLLASFAYVGNSSPIHRGVLIARNLLGRTLKPPPAAFVPLAADLHPNLTTRQRVALQTSPAACAACHQLINPLGFSLEKFDASGALRARENDMPVDATGGYKSPTGEEVKFAGARDLAHFLADSEEVHTAFTQKLFQYMVKQPIRAFGPNALTDLRHTFEANHLNMRQQMIETAVWAAIEPQHNLNKRGKPQSGTKSDTLKASEKISGQPQPRGIPKT